MPANVIKTKKDEKYWSECKKSVHEAHPKLSEKSTQFYKMVMGCFQKKKSGSENLTEFEKYIEDRRNSKNKKMGR
jgi:hypothetical protein